MYFFFILKGFFLDRRVIPIMRRNKSISERYCRGRLVTGLCSFNLADRRGSLQVVSGLIVVIAFDF